MNIASSSSLHALGRTFERVERIAERVAFGEAGEGNLASSLAELPALETTAAANVRVLRTASEMLDVLASLPRR